MELKYSLCILVAEFSFTENIGIIVLLAIVVGVVLGLGECETPGCG